MKALSLFCGIGGFDLALAQHGVQTVAGCDSDPFVAKLFEQRFGVPVVPDVREIDASFGHVDVVCGGFPCQPSSQAGKRLGQDDERWLWPEFQRVIGALRPSWVFIENVPGLRTKGMLDVLQGLDAVGYDCEFDGIPAAAVGAPHIRDRVWIVAWPRNPRVTVFGSPTGLLPIWHVGDQRARPAIPRAGRMTSGHVYELEPLAPIKTERVDGWTRWAGVRLTAAPVGRVWPTPVVSDRLGSRNLTCDRPNGNGKSHSGTTLLDALILNGDADMPESGVMPDCPMLPTPMSSMAAQGQGGGELHRVVNHEMLPTPCARDYKGQDMPGRTGPPSLGGVAAAGLWPTPAAADGTGGRNESAALERNAEAGAESARSPTRPSGTKAAISLASAVDGNERGLWPTPKASPSGPDYARIDREDSGSDDLATAVAKTMLPTPRATDGDARNRGDLIAHVKERPNSHCPAPREEGRSDERRKGPLNPGWVEWLQGFPSGWTDPDCEDPQPHAWDREPGERVKQGVPRRRERLTALGNALVPQVAAFVVSRAAGRAGSLARHDGHAPADPSQAA